MLSINHLHCNNVSFRKDFAIIRVFLFTKRGRRGRDRMVVGLRTTYAISAYHR